jgi:hypothetical protein
MSEAREAEQQKIPARDETKHSLSVRIRQKMSAHDFLSAPAL